MSVLAVNEAGRGGWSKDSIEAGLGEEEVGVFVLLLVLLLL